MSILDRQPNPINESSDDVWQEIIDELPEHLLFLKPFCIERRQQGIERYGVPLSRNNGRDPLVDAVQEGLDMAVYMKAEGCPDWKEPLEIVSSLMWRMAKRGP